MLSPGVFAIAITLGKRNRLHLKLCSSPSYFENNLSLHRENSLGHYTTTHENITLTGDFNVYLERSKF